jgi:hypothetical protein
MAMEGTKVETLIVEWRAEYDRYKSDMANIRKEVDTVKESIQKSAQTASSSTQVASKSMIEQFGAIAAKLGLAAIAVRTARAAFNELKASIRLAMDVRESESLFETSLGNMADASREWSKQVAEALGVNDYEIRRTVGLWYTMGESMGLVSDNAISMSRNLNLLKYDIMSFNNLGEDQTDTMIKALYSGESEPWKNIGVIMTEQMAKQALYKAGLAEVGQEIDTTLMLYGRYLTVMEQTATAQGDMARTIDSPLNQLRRFNASLNDIRLSLGNAFLPIIQVALPALQSLASLVQANLQLMEQFTGAMGSKRTSGLQIGTSQINKAVNEGGQAWNDYGNKADEGLKKAAAGVKALRGMIFGLDEINFESDNSSGSGVGTGGGALTPGIGFEQPELPEFDVPESIDDSIARYKEKLQGLADWIREHNKVLRGIIALTPFGLLALLIEDNIKKIKLLAQESIPEYKFLPDDISEETAAKLGPFMELWHDVDTTIKQYAWGSQEVSEEAAAAIAAAYEAMALDVQAAIQEQTDESYETMSLFFANSNVLTEEEEAAMLAAMQESAAEKKKTIQDYTSEITDIYNTASEENRALTEEEQIRVNEIQQLMKEQAIEAMSESAAEQERILRHLEVASGDITARQAADVVANSLDAKQKTIENAIDQADTIIDEATRMKEAGLINEETYNKIVDEAEKQRDETIAAAEETHRRVVEEAQLQAGEHVDKVNWETGEIKTNWELAKEALTERWNGMRDWFDEHIKPWFSAETWRNLFKDLVKQIKDGWEDVKLEIANRVKLPKLEWPKIKMPHFTLSYDASWGGGFGSNAAKKIGELLGIPGQPQLDVRWYAAGGLPSRGELFIANEAGPELIGRMGSQNAVANQMQIVDGIADGVRRAMQDVQRGDSSDLVLNVYVDGVYSHSERISRKNLRAGRTIIPVEV